MGIPKAGSGPLIDYELNLLDYTDVSWINRKQVLTGVEETTTYVFAGNMAQAPNTAGKVLEIFGDSLFLQILYTDEYGTPGNNTGTADTFPVGIVGAGYRSGSKDNPFTFNVTTAINNGWTLGWGASPMYSAEVDVIQF
jgi:hypothetical protein